MPLAKSKETIFGILPRLFGLEARVYVMEQERTDMAKTLQEVKTALENMNATIQANTTAITTLAQQVGEVAKKNEDAINNLQASAQGETDNETLVNSINQAAATMADNNSQLGKISSELQARVNSLDPQTDPALPSPEGHALPIATTPMTVNVGTGTELAPGQPDVIQPPQQG